MTGPGAGGGSSLRSDPTDDTAEVIASARRSMFAVRKSVVNAPQVAIQSGTDASENVKMLTENAFCDLYMGWGIDFSRSKSERPPAFVLIVEDSDDVTPLEIALTALDSLQVKVATNGRDALELIKQHHLEVAAVITDLNLPFLDGFGLIAAVRSHAPNAKLPIIVISGDNDPTTQTRVRDLGANAFFGKPYSPAAIRHTLENLLHAP
jgi:two-component system chemotaxis response regulator CheY